MSLVLVVFEVEGKKFGRGKSVGVVGVLPNGHPACPHIIMLTGQAEFSADGSTVRLCPIIRELAVSFSVMPHYRTDEKYHYNEDCGDEFFDGFHEFGIY